MGYEHLSATTLSFQNKKIMWDYFIRILESQRENQRERAREPDLLAQPYDTHGSIFAIQMENNTKTLLRNHLDGIWSWQSKMAVGVLSSPDVKSAALRCTVDY